MREIHRHTTGDVPLEAESDKKKEATLSLLQRQGLLTMVEGNWVIDSERFKELGTEGIREGKHVFSGDLLEALRSIKARDKNDGQDGGDVKTEPRPVVSLPKSLSSLPGFYQTAESNSILKPWEISGNSNSIYRPIRLDSGEEITTAELRVAGILLGQLKARRNTAGVLEIWNGESFEPFTAGSFRKLSGINPTSKTQGNKEMRLHGNGLAFIQKHLPRLLESGVFQRQDFKVQGGSSTAETFNVNERRLNPKAPFVNFTTAPGRSAKYYIGREKLVGTEERIDPEKMNVRLLDPNTAGVVEERHGKKTLRYVFNLLGEGEVEEKQKLLLQKGMGRRDLPDNVTVSAAEMKQRMNKYNVTDYAPQHSKESARDYAERVSRLSDVGFVTETFQKFFSEAGIGVHRLPWSEQLVLASAILEEKDRDRLLDFAKNYGVNGVRSLLSLDFGRKMGQHILELGEKGEQKIVAEIFNKYAGIVDSAKKIEGYAARTFGNKVEAADLNKIRESLLSKAKDLLESFDAKDVDSLEAVKVIHQLDNINEDVLLFASTFKEVSKQVDFSVEDFLAKSVEISDSSELTTEDKNQMLAMFESNREFYPPELRELTLKEFEKMLGEPGHQFRILRQGKNVIAFIGVDYRKDGIAYAHSFNLDPNAKGTSIAIAMAKTGLDEVGKNHDVEAVVYANNPILGYYKKFLGFKEVGRTKYHGSEQEYIKLMRPKTARQEQPAEQAA